MYQTTVGWRLGTNKNNITGHAHSNPLGYAQQLPLVFVRGRPAKRLQLAVLCNFIYFIVF
jgi:hypothetical protein